ncbi:hypothetical protein FRC01_003254 [Tulasnella sp. 417]|nr:hypothetical protein FRC01_003254 [Tulasnella sp. 417]
MVSQASRTSLAKRRISTATTLASQPKRKPTLEEISSGSESDDPLLLVEAPRKRIRAEDNKAGPSGSGASLSSSKRPLPKLIPVAEVDTPEKLLGVKPPSNRRNITRTKDRQPKSTSKDLTSIRDIPLELLLSIFRLSFDIDTTSLQRDRCRLSLVCRWWRDIVQDSACLWTDISAHDSESYIEKSLVKSAGFPIDIQYISLESRSERPNLEAYLKLVFKHLPRCRSISLFMKEHRFGDLTELLNRLRTAPPPGLESLALKGSGFQRRDATPRERQYVVGITAFPALRRLEFDGIRCALAPPGLLVNDFRSLNLIEVDKVEAEELLEALRNSPRLERLGLGRSPSECPSQSAVVPIHLPQLLALHLIYLPIEVSNFLLTTIHAPNCSELFISSHFPKFPDDVVRESLFTSNTDHFSPVLRRLLTRGQYKDIEFFRHRGYRGNNVYFNVRFHDDDSSDPLHSGIFRLEFQLHSSQVEETIRWFTSYSGRDMPKIPIRLQLDGDLEVFIYNPCDPPESQNETMLDMLRRRYNPSSKEADIREVKKMLPQADISLIDDSEKYWTW